jgi:MFS family permease
MARIAPPPKMPPRRTQDARVETNFWQSVKKCFRQPGFKTFVAVQTFYGVAFFGIPSLSLIYLREKVGITPNLILFFSTAGIFGATFAAIFWGRWIDRRGALSLQLLAFAGLSVNSLLWFSTGLLGADFLNFGLAAMVSFFSAIWISALGMSQTHSIMTLAPEEDRVLFQNIATFITYCSQALAPMVWGILIDYLDNRRFSMNVGGLELGAFRLFFLASIVVGLSGVAFLGRTLWQARKNRQELAP